MMFLLTSSPLPPPSADQLFGWLSCLCAILGIIVLARKAWGGDRPPQPFIVQGDVRFATHEELTKVEKRVEAIQQETRGEIKELRETIVTNYNAQMTASAKGRSGLHKEISDVAIIVHRMDETVTNLRSVLLPAPLVPPSTLSPKKVSHEQ